MGMGMTQSGRTPRMARTARRRLDGSAAVHASVLSSALIRWLTFRRINLDRSNTVTSAHANNVQPTHPPAPTVAGAAPAQAAPPSRTRQRTCARPLSSVAAAADNLASPNK